MVEQTIDNGCGSWRPHHRQSSRSAIVPGSEYQVAESTDMVEVVMGDEHGVQIGNSDIRSRELRRDPSPRVE
jgi:hypothetical protein